MNYLLVLPKEAAKSTGHNVFPVGIAYVSAFLKLKGHNVYTANLEFCEGTTADALKGIIEKHAIDVLCTSGLSRDYPRLKSLIDIARTIKPNLLIVVGGGIISGDPQPAMIALEADIGVIGQGEITMHELATALDRDLSYENVPGLIFKSHDRYITTCVRQDVKNLDELPFPDYDGFAFPDYMRQINYEVAFITASRSCPFKCTFCFHPSGDRYRKRSLDNIFLEIDYLLNTYKVDTLCISDELFAPKRDRVIEFCDRIAPYNLKWAVQLRVCDVDEELLTRMRDSGCISISYGIESADDGILTSMAKKITLAQIEKALKLTYQIGIDIQGGLIFGDASETTESVNNSLKWYDDHAHYALDLNMINIFPGTLLYRNALARGIVKDSVKFLTDGCPLINVSKLSEEEYIGLASNLYERNMRAKYEPNIFEVGDFKEDGSCLINMACNKCGNHFSANADAMHILQIPCPKCRQRHYVDPFKKLSLQTFLPDEYFANDEHVVLWGGGEICIKLLDNYPILKNEKFTVVDSSKSRQGYSVCEKKIVAPAFIDKYKIKAVILTVVRRKNEIMRQLANHPSIEHIYLPRVRTTNGNGTNFTLEKL
jgi:anaerobic magnesium-protoporphyrin IX monomethyl ester cyclase